MDLPLRRYWDLLLKYLKPLKLKVTLLTLLIFSSIGLQLINPQIIRYFIDTAVTGGYDQSLLWAALLFLAMSLLLQMVSVLATYVSADVGWQTTNRLRADLARHCLKLDLSFHNDYTPGEMIERIDGDVAEIATFFTQFVIHVVANLLLLLGVLLILIPEDWRISLALAIFSLIAMTGLGYIRQVAIPYWKAARQAHADLFGFLEERLAGTEDIRSSGAVTYTMSHLFNFNHRRLERELKGETMANLMAWMWFGVHTLGLIVALIVSYILFRAGALTLGSVYLVIHYTTLIFRPLSEITGQFQGVQRAVASIDRVEALLSLKSKIGEKGQRVLPVGPLAVTFDQVSFGYTPEIHVLQQISFQLKPGQVLGLLGRTGSGKTTLARLLFRLYEPAGGVIRLGNNGHQCDIQEFSLEHLRRHVGLVTQEVQLFHATVRDNLTFFDRAIPDSAILEVINDLGLAGWYGSLADGLDTVLEARGSNLSAGEAQLLAFARVFLKNPGLVILDEASSRLDPVTEQRLERAMARLLQDRTAIIVAHRLSTVHHADQIMIIEAGQIQELGDYNDLAADPASRFYRLLQVGLEEVQDEIPG
jgi:ABC-type multidrug transport system fused ATPase/permease subunit